MHKMAGYTIQVYCNPPPPQIFFIKQQVQATEVHFWPQLNKARKYWVPNWRTVLLDVDMEYATWRRRSTSEFKNETVAWSNSFLHTNHCC